MEFIKYFTNPQFDNAKFADMLRLRMNVRAKAVEDGVILDRDAFNATSAAFMPNWAWLNKQSINSPLHTRPAEPAEWPDLTHAYRYLLAIVFDDKDACQLEQADGLEYISEQADMVAGYWRKEEGFYGVAVFDNEEKKVVYTAE